MPTFLAAPTGLALSVLFVSGQPVIQADFNAVTDAVKYALSVHPASATRAGGYTRTDRFTGTTKTLTGLAGGQDWFVRVYAIGADGTAGVRSRRARITVPEAEPDEPEDSPDPPPAPQPGDPIAPPTNLRAVPVSGQDACTLSWDARTGAVTYKLYRLEDLALLATITAPTTSYLLTGSAWRSGARCFVTATGDNDMESLPSAAILNISGKAGWNNPNSPAVPTNLIATPQWNDGAPQNLIEWDTNNTLWHEVYRNGSKIAEGILRLYYVDRNVTAGVTYSYQVRSVIDYGNPGSAASYRYSSLSAAVNCATRTGQPAAITNPLVVAAGASGPHYAFINITPLAGAVDYRAYPIGTAPYEGAKYAGRGSTSIQVAGLPNGSNVTYIVEALDKLGPFQRHEKQGFPGHHDLVHVNGHGDPGNVPSVLQATTIALQGTAITLTGSQQHNVDFGTYDYDADLATDSISSSLAAAHGKSYPVATNDHLLRAYQNSDFRFYFLRVNQEESAVFGKGKHLMWVNADGGTHPFPPRHNNNATLGLEYKDAAALTGSQVLRVVVDIDGHMSSRRWINLLLRDTADPFYLPDDQFFNKPVVSNQFVRVSIFHDQTVLGWNHTGGSAVYYRSPAQNGGQPGLDRVVRFEMLYRASDRRVLFKEGGVTIFDRIATGLTMPSTAIGVNVHHQVYHTNEDVQDHLRNGCFERYWIAHRLFEDERHLFGFAYEVLSAWPS